MNPCPAQFVRLLTARPSVWAVRATPASARPAHLHQSRPHPPEVWCLATSLQRGRVFPLIPVQARANLLLLRLWFVSAHACKLHHVLDLLLFPPSKHRCCCPQGRKAARSRVLRIGGEEANAFTLEESVPAVHGPHLKQEFEVKYCSARSSTNGEHLFCTSRAIRFLRHERANPSIKRTVKGLRPSPAAYVKR